jgi:NAD-dependent DNA ligase
MKNQKIDVEKDRKNIRIIIKKQDSIDVHFLSVYSIRIMEDQKEEKEKEYNSLVKTLVQGKTVKIRRPKKEKVLLQSAREAENPEKTEKNLITTKVHGRLNESLIELMEELAAFMTKRGEHFKSRAYQKAQETLILDQREITPENYKVLLKNASGIGETIMKKISEYVETGTLRVLERERADPRNIFSEIYGIGPKKADNLVEKGVKTIAELRARQDEVLNSVQKVGLQYYEDILQRIPREEIDEYNTIFRSTFQKVVAKVGDKQSHYEIVGSYRRGAKTSGDIDIIITAGTPEVFRSFVDALQESGIILEVLSRGPSKCLVITKIHDAAHARRVDFLFSTMEEFPFSILYFTGSKIFNTVMRGRALMMGYSLNEHGLYTMAPGSKIKGAKLDRLFSDERSIFRFLKMEYKKPEERIDGRSVVPLTTGLAPPAQISAIRPSTPPIESTKPNITYSLKEVSSPKKEKTRKKRLTQEEKEKAKEEKEKEKKQKKEEKTKANLIKKEETRKTKALNKAEEKTRKIRIKKKPVVIVEPTIMQVETLLPSAKPIPVDQGSNDPVLHSIQHFKMGGISVLQTLSEETLNAMLTRSNDAYYNVVERGSKQGSTVLLTDNEYDILKEFIQEKFPKNMVVKEIGAPIEGKNKATLPYQMPSMDKIKPDTGALESWKQRYPGPYVISCKLDGVSGMYIFKGQDKGATKLYTRGNGTVGQDISHMIPYLRLPSLSGSDEIAVRGEFIMTKSNFKNKYAGVFANARNLVAGTVNRLTMDEKVGDLDFVCYEVIHPVIKPSDQMAFLRDHGFNTVRNMTWSPEMLTNEALSGVLIDWRTNYEYEMDGVIVAHDRIYKREAGNPDHAFAFKMVLSDQMAEVKVVDVLWTASKDGYLKPRVQIEPVVLSGAKIEYATGFNGAFIEINRIGIGAIIQIIRSGDVIPHIRAVIVPAEQAKMPSVAYEWNDTHVDVLLQDASQDETVVAKNITGFFKGLEVDGLSAGNVARLIAAGFDTVPKILAMSKADYLTVDGFKDKMATKLADGIKSKVSGATLTQIMAASNTFGRGFSDKRIELVLEEYPEVLMSSESKTEKVARLSGIKGMAKKTAEAFVEHIPAFLGFLESCGLTNKITGLTTANTNANTSKKVNVVVARELDTSHPLYKKTVVMSGTRDKELTQWLKDVGAILGAAVSSKTFALVSPEPESNTGKVATAKSLGIPVLTPEAFVAKYRL